MMELLDQGLLVEKTGPSLGESVLAVEGLLSMKRRVRSGDRFHCLSSYEVRELLSRQASSQLNRFVAIRKCREAQALARGPFGCDLLFRVIECINYTCALA